MEKKVLYKVLRQIRYEGNATSAPDDDYVRALKTLGLIEMGWEYRLTEFGQEVLKILENNLNKW